jgi:ribose-phosphate pyrophosphokinase
LVPSAKIFAVRSSKVLAEKIAKAYGQPIGKIELSEFSDGEFQPSFEETVRGGRVFLIGSTNQPTQNLMELLLMIDAAKRASAKHITAVMPYFGWARQDRKDKSRVPIGAKMVAKMLETAGATRIMTMDLHADQIQGFFEVPVDHVFASALFVPHIKNLALENLTIASPDMGGSKRANNYAKWLTSEVVICYKQRKKANVIDKMTVIGNVEGRNVILIDDMIDTAGTLTKAADMLIEQGALSVRAYCTHGVLSGKALERIQKSKLDELVITDTIPHTNLPDKIKVISVADLFANIMNKVHQHESISSHFLE